jgi:hypothetical protein
VCIFVLCLNVVPLSPDKTPFAVQINNNNNNNNNKHKVADDRSHAIQGKKCALKHWNRGLKSHLRHNCVFEFIQCLCSPVPCNGLIIRPRGPTNCI